MYLGKSGWTDEPTLPSSPTGTSRGMKGGEIDLWAYSSMDEVELRVSGKSLGRKPMPATAICHGKLSTVPVASRP